MKSGGPVSLMNNQAKSGATKVAVGKSSAEVQASEKKKLGVRKQPVKLTEADLVNLRGRAQGGDHPAKV